MKKYYVEVCVGLHPITTYKLVGKIYRNLTCCVKWYNHVFRINNSARIVCESDGKISFIHT